MSATLCTMLTRSISILVLATACSDGSGTLDPPSRGISAERRAFDARVERISAELAGDAMRPAWAGRYTITGTPAVNLELAPRSGFAWSSSCFGTEVRSGDLLVERDRIVLPTRAPPPFGFPSTLVPITWGERRYVVPRDEIERFLETAQRYGASEAKWIGWLVRAEDELRRAYGEPRVELPLDVSTR